MENENLNEQQPAPVVEKVTKKTLKTEKAKLEVENDKVVKNFIDSVLALSDEELDMAIDFMRKKLDKLKNLK